MKLKHTPGPWSYGQRESEVGSNYYRIKTSNDVLSGDNLVGYCGEANARLIAAAPEAPHECDDPKCPGNINRQKLELYDEMVKALQEIYEDWNLSIIKSILDRVEALK